jgi:hypothetical protein
VVSLCVRDEPGSGQLEAISTANWRLGSCRVTEIPTSDKPLLFGKILSRTQRSHRSPGVDEVRLWDDVRTGAEIRDNMAGPNEASRASGLWRFSEPSGSTIVDIRVDGKLGGVVSG